MDTGLGNLAIQQIAIGALHMAEANLRRSVDLCREIEDGIGEAIGHRDLGQLLAYRGAWADAETVLTRALTMFEERSEIQPQEAVCAYQALRELLLRRSKVGVQG